MADDPGTASFGRYALASDAAAAERLRLLQRVYGPGSRAFLTRAGVPMSQPAFARGEEKRVLEWSLAEAAQSFIDARLVTRAELDRTLAEMRRLADDESAVVVMPRMSQVFGVKA
jgi:hypothetical protein